MVGNLQMQKLITFEGYESGCVIGLGIANEGLIISRAILTNESWGLHCFNHITISISTVV
jgi:hypothetical protein